MVFTSLGKMYKINVDKIPEGTNSSKGINIQTLLSLSLNETIQTICSFNKGAKYVVFFTEKGLMKKTLFTEYSSMKKTTGIQALKIKEGDRLIKVAFLESDNEDILLFSKKGMSIRFPAKENKAIGRLNCGSKAIKLKKDDYVISAIVLNKKNKIIITTKCGRGKQVPSDDFNPQMVGGVGVSAIKLEKNDEIADVVAAGTSQSLFITGTPNSICIPIAEIPTQTKSSMGTKLIEKSIIQNIITI